MHLTNELSPALNRFLFASSKEEQKQQKKVSISDKDLKILAAWLKTKDGKNWVHDHSYLSKKMIRFIAASSGINHDITNKLIKIFIPYTPMHAKIIIDIFEMYHMQEIKCDELLEIVEKSILSENFLGREEIINYFTHALNIFEYSFKEINLIFNLLFKLNCPVSKLTGKYIYLYNSNILHIKAMLDQDDLLQEFAEKYPNEFDKLLFQENYLRTRPIDCNFMSIVFFSKLLKIRKELFLTPNEKGLTYFHLRKNCVFFCPSFFEDPKAQEILLRKVGEKSLFESLADEHFEKLIDNFSFMEQAILAIAIVKLQKYPHDRKLNLTILEPFFEKASDQTIFTLVDGFIHHRNIDIINNFYYYKDILYKALRKDPERNKQFCEYLLEHGFTQNISDWMGFSPEIVYQIIIENPKKEYSANYLTTFLRDLEKERLKELIKIAVKEENKNLMEAIFLVDTSFVKLPEFSDDTYQKYFTRVLSPNIDTLLHFFETRPTKQLELIENIIHLAPKKIIDWLSRKKYFYNMHSGSSDSLLQYRIKLIQILDNYPNELRDVLIAPSKNGFILAGFYQEVLSLLAEYAAKIWKITDYGRRNLLHALGELSPNYLRYAISLPQLEALKDQVDETGRTPIQTCFEKFPKYFMKHDASVAKEGFLFQNSINRKSFLHSADNLGDVKFLQKIKDFLVRENLVDQVMGLEDANQRKPHYNIMSQLTFGMDCTIDKLCAVQLNIIGHLVQDDKQNVDLVYESILSPKKSNAHLEFLIECNKKNFGEALNRFKQNKNFPFSKKTYELLFSLIKYKYPDIYIDILETIPFLRKGRVNDFLEMLFIDPVNKFPEIIGAIGKEKLAAIIHKDSYSYSRHFQKWIRETDGWNERNDNFFELIYSLYPDLLLYYVKLPNSLTSRMTMKAYEVSLLPRMPIIKEIWDDYWKNKHPSNAKKSFLDAIYQHFEKFCTQPDPMKAALIACDTTLMEKTAKKIGFEATFKLLANIKKFYPLPLPITETLFFNFDASHLQTEALDPDLVKILDHINLKELLALFDQINFSDPSDMNYFNPQKLKNDGATGYVLISPNKARESLVGLIDKIKNETPETGTPPKDTEELKQFYMQLASLIKQIIYQINEQKKSCAELSPQEKREAALECIDAVLTMAIAGLYCGGRWLGDALLTLDLLKKEQLDLEKILLRIQASHRLAIAEQLAFQSKYKGNVHALNSILILLGPEFKIPGYEYVIEQLPAHFDPIKLRSDFLALYTPQAIVENIYQKINEKQMYKNLVLQWFKHNAGDYKKVEYMEKLLDLKADKEWQLLVKNRLEGKLSEEADTVLAFLKYAAALPKERIKEFFDDLSSSSDPDELDFLLVPFIRRSVEINSDQCKVVGRVLKEKKLVASFLNAYQDPNAQEKIKKDWIKSKLDSEETFIDKIIDIFRKKDLIIEKETVRMLLKESDSDKRVDAFMKKIEELLERQRSDDYLNEVLVETGMNNEDEAIYDFDRIKMVKLLTHFKILAPIK